MSVADNIFLSAIVLVVFYSYHAGFLRLTKPIVSILSAKLICPALSILLQRTPLGDALRKRIAEKVVIHLPDYPNTAEYIAGGILTVASFFVIYVIIRIIIEFIYTLFKPNFKFAKKLDKFLGITLGLIVVFTFTYMIYAGGKYLALTNIGFARRIVTSVDNSFIVKHVLKGINIILDSVAW